MKLVYSYHTFIFPFIWKTYFKVNNRRDFKDIKAIFKHNAVWADDDLSKEYWHQIEIDEDATATGGLNENKLKYATYQYFQPTIRDAIFGEENDSNTKEVVQSYSFKPIKNDQGKSSKRAKYIIQKQINDKDKRYNLDLADIKLRLYNTGVGLLAFVCENRENTTLADVKNINDYGRRITLPFIPDSSNINDSLCADSITISWDGMEDTIKQDFRTHIISFNNKSNVLEDNPKMSHIADFVKEILNYSSGKSESSWQFTTNRQHNKNDKFWYIQPALDDRMFVMCAVNKNYQDLFWKGLSCSPFEYLSTLQSWQLGSSKKKPFNYEELEKSFYEFIFCDPAGKCSCSFGQMRQQLINEHLYYRWLHPTDGTLYCVAAQAFMCVSDVNYILNYFRTIYYELACLVLVQRVSLRVLQNEASYLSAHLEDKDNKVNKGSRRDIANLQEKLIAFQNQINLYEISSQEQAIELYDMMREVFMVNKHTSILQEQLNGLYNIANIHQNEAFSHLAGTIAMIALIVALPSFINDFAFFPAEWHIGEEKGFEGYGGIILIVKIILAIIIWRIIYNMWKE